MRARRALSEPAAPMLWLLTSAWPSRSVALRPALAMRWPVSRTFWPARLSACLVLAPAVAEGLSVARSRSAEFCAPYAALQVRAATVRRAEIFIRIPLEKECFITTHPPPLLLSDKLEAMRRLRWMTIWPKLVVQVLQETFHASCLPFMGLAAGHC